MTFGDLRPSRNRRSYRTAKVQIRGQAEDIPDERYYCFANNGMFPTKFTRLVIRDLAGKSGPTLADPVIPADKKKERKEN